MFWALAVFHHTKPTIVNIFMRALDFLLPYFLNAAIFRETFVCEFNWNNKFSANFTALLHFELNL